MAALISRATYFFHILVSPTDYNFIDLAKNLGVDSNKGSEKFSVEKLVMLSAHETLYFFSDTLLLIVFTDIYKYFIKMSIL